jgi:hypothetical protein
LTYLKRECYAPNLWDELARPRELAEAAAEPEEAEDRGHSPALVDMGCGSVSCSSSRFGIGLLFGHQRFPNSSSSRQCVTGG